MKQSEVAKLVAILKAAYPTSLRQLGREDLERTLELYEIMLSDLEFDETYAAVLAHIAGCKWFPTIAELRHRVISTRLQLPSVEAAIELVRACRPGTLRGGGADLPAPVREALKVCGGLWESQNTTNPTTWRAQFRVAYEALRAEAIQVANEAPVRQTARLNSAAIRQLEGSDVREATTSTRRG